MDQDKQGAVPRRIFSSSASPLRPTAAVNSSSDETGSWFTDSIMSSARKPADQAGLPA